MAKKIKKFLVDIDLNMNQMSNVAAPTQSGQVATYEWVSGLIQDEVATRQSEDQLLDGKIADIISNTDITAIDSFTEVVDKINFDISVVSDNLSSEVDARVSGDVSISDRIDAIADGVTVDFNADGKIQLATTVEAPKDVDGNEVARTFDGRVQSGQNTAAIADNSSAKGVDTIAGVKKFASVYSDYTLGKKMFNKLYVNWHNGFSKWNQSQIDQYQYTYLAIAQRDLEVSQYKMDLANSILPWQQLGSFTRMISKYNDMLADTQSGVFGIPVTDANGNSNEDYFKYIHHPFSMAINVLDWQYSVRNELSSMRNFNYPYRYEVNDATSAAGIAGYSSYKTFKYSGQRTLTGNMIWENQELIGYLEYLRNKLVSGITYNGYTAELIPKEDYYNGNPYMDLSIDALPSEYEAIMASLGIDLDENYNNYSKYIKYEADQKLNEARVKSVSYYAGKLIVKIQNEDTSTNRKITIDNLDKTFASKDFGGEVFDMAIQPDGKIVLVGGFSQYGGKSVNGIIRLNADGTKDETFADSFVGSQNETYKVLLLQSGKLLMQSTVNGNKYLLRLNADGTLDSTLFDLYDSGYLSADIYDIAEFVDGRILIAGISNANNAGFIKSLNADGSLDTSIDFGTGFNNSVKTAVIMPNGKILVGGEFTQYNGQDVSRIARLNADGSLDASFVCSVEGYVNKIALTADENILFSGYNLNQHYQSTITWKGLYVDNLEEGVVTFYSPLDISTDFTSGTLILKSSVNGDITGEYPYTSVVSIANESSTGYIVRIYLEDRYFSAGGSNKFACDSANLSSSFNETQEMGGWYTEFTTPLGKKTASIVKVDQSGAFLKTAERNYCAGYNNGSNIAVFDFAEHSNGDIYIITNYDMNFYVLDSNLNNKLGAVSVYSAPRHVKVDSQGKVYLCGNNLYQYGQLSAGNKGVFKIDPQISVGNLDRSFAMPSIGAGIRATAVQQDGKVILAGEFRTVNDSMHSSNGGYVESIKSKSIARFNTDGTYDTSFASPFNELNEGVWTNRNISISSICVLSSGKILVASDYNSSNTYEHAGKILRLNPDGSIDASFDGGGFSWDGNNFEFSGIVETKGGFLPGGEKIIVTGTFTSRNSSTANRIIRLNQDGTTDTNFYGGFTNGNMNQPYIYTIKALANGNVFIGGSFPNVSYEYRFNPADANSATSYYSNSFYMIKPNGMPDISFIENLSRTGTVYGIESIQDGYLIIFDSTVYKVSLNGHVDDSFGEVQSNAFTVDSVGRIYSLFQISWQSFLRRYDSSGELDISAPHIELQTDASHVSGRQIHLDLQERPFVIADSISRMQGQYIDTPYSPSIAKFDLDRSVGTKFITIEGNISDTSHTDSTFVNKIDKIRAFTQADASYGSEFIHRCLYIPQNYGLRSSVIYGDFGGWYEIERGQLAFNDNLPISFDGANGRYNLLSGHDSGRYGIAIDENDDLNLFKIDLAIKRLHIRNSYLQNAEYLLLRTLPNGTEQNYYTWRKSDGTEYADEQDFINNVLTENVNYAITPKTVAELNIENGSTDATSWFEGFANGRISEMNSIMDSINAYMTGWRSEYTGYQANVEVYQSKVELGGGYAANGDLFIILPEEAGNISSLFSGGSFISDSVPSIGVGTIQEFAGSYLNPDGTKQGLQIGWASYEQLNPGSFYDSPDTASDDAMFPFKYYDANGNLQNYNLSGNSPRTVIHLNYNGATDVEGTDGMFESVPVFSVNAQDQDSNWNWTNVTFNNMDADDSAKTLSSVYLNDSKSEYLGDTVHTPIKWNLHFNTSFGDISNLFSDGNKIKGKIYSTEVEIIVSSSTFDADNSQTVLEIYYSIDPSRKYSSGGDEYVLYGTQDDKFFIRQYGSVTIEQVYNSDNTLSWSVGDYTAGVASSTEGRETKALGNSSHAEGEYTQAIGERSHAEGESTQAIGVSSHAEGQNTQAIGSRSHAEGRGTQAIGENSHAEGVDTQAIGYASHAEGESTKAIGIASHAEGRYTKAIGHNSHAEGYQTVAGRKVFDGATITAINGFKAFNNVEFVFTNNYGLYAIVRDIDLTPSGENGNFAFWYSTIVSNQSEHAYNMNNSEFIQPGQQTSYVDNSGQTVYNATILMLSASRVENGVAYVNDAITGNEFQVPAYENQIYNKGVSDNYSNGGDPVSFLGNTVLRDFRLRIDLESRFGNINNMFSNGNILNMVYQNSKLSLQVDYSEYALGKTRIICSYQAKMV